MSLIRREALGRTWDPFRELEDMSSRLNRVFARSTAADEALKTVDFTPSINVSETPQAYLIKAELPGVKKEDVHLTVENSLLTLRGERRYESEHKDEKVHRVESAYGSFMRQFRVPEDATPDGIEATYKDGVLSVRLAKAPPKREPEAKRIPVG
jgi:HSP20 family protein